MVATIYSILFGIGVLAVIFVTISIVKVAFVK